MPRCSSLRSGLLLTLFLALAGYGTFAFAQVGSMDPMQMGGMSGAPGAMGAAGAQQGAITNVGSGIKRSASSLGSVQALLYGDAASVVRVNLAKIDYESLAKFVDDFVDKAGGSVRSDDKYLVQLREFQKSDAKSSFKKLLSTVQNMIVQRCFNKKIDEAYIIVYQNEKGDGCAICAIPTEGLSDADKKTALDAISDFRSPITVFNRYGFIVAVYSHDAAESVDLESIQEKYLAKLKEEERGSAYGSYGASKGGANAYGSEGSGFGGMSQGASFGSGTSDGMMGAGMMGAGMNGSQNGAVQNPKYPNFGLSQKLYAEYVEEVTTAQEKSHSSARKSVLPYVRRRFEKPATAEESAKLFDALRQVDGVALAVAFVDPNSLKSIVKKQAGSKDDAVSQPFSALGSDDPQDSFKPMEVVSSALESENKWNAAAFGLSLVGAPKLVAILTFPDEETAKTEAENSRKAFALSKTLVLGSLNNAVSKAETEEKVDFAPLVDSVFDSLQPQVNGSKFAVVLDTAPIQEHAALFLPLLGGTETKEVAEQESDEIDWSLGEEKKADDSAATAPAQTQAPAEDDPFAESSEPTTKDSKKDSTDDSEDDPFGSDDDPF